MTVFAKRAAMNVEVWGKLQDQLAQLQLALGVPYDLMMFSVNNEEEPICQDIYIGLPDHHMLAAFPGFEPIERSNLPDFLVTLIAREDGFRDFFPDIAAKRRARHG
jgi:hypothetical protein